MTQGEGAGLCSLCMPSVHPDRICAASAAQNTGLQLLILQLMSMEGCSGGPAPCPIHVLVLVLQAFARVRTSSRALMYSATTSSSCQSLGVQKSSGLWYGPMRNSSAAIWVR